MVKIKICGTTNLEDALLCSREGADALGFIFTKKSPRYINEKQAAKIIGQIDPFVVTVGVFLDEEKEKVLKIADMLNLDILQFHGNESPAYCNFFRPKFKVIKVLFAQNRPFAKAVAGYNVDAYLFDLRQEEKLKGKNILEKEYLQEILSLIKEGECIIISGGLNSKNIRRVVRLGPYAVDVASGVEKLVGKKDNDLVHAFIQKVKNVNTR